jgi:hypothetical protein
MKVQRFATIEMIKRVKSYTKKCLPEGRQGFEKALAQLHYF